MKTFLKNLGTEVDILNYIDIENIDFSDAYNSIYEMIDESGGFDIEIIGYYNAMEYLKENDYSLNQSIELACDMGYELKNVNSELLASLLASQNVRYDFMTFENEINSYFEDYGTDKKNS